MLKDVTLRSMKDESVFHFFAVKADAVRFQCMVTAKVCTSTDQKYNILDSDKVVVFL